MITQSTVFILGAGASASIGFPVMSELKRKILDAPRRAHSIRLPDEFTEFDSAVTRLVTAYGRSGLVSIDRFLESRPEFAVLGKRLIASVLLPIESTVFPRADHQGTWYETVFQAMYEDFESFPKNRVSFVTFNYDRSVEYLLATMLANSSGRPIGDSLRQVLKLRIAHVYGSLAQEPLFSPDQTHIQVDKSSVAMNTASCGIRIMSEDRQDQVKEMLDAQMWIREAQRIIILGFAFDPTNVSRLGFEPDGLTSRRMRASIFASAFGLGEPMRRQLETMGVHPSVLGLPTQNCEAFLKECVSL